MRIPSVQNLPHGSLCVQHAASTLVTEGVCMKIWLVAGLSLLSIGIARADCISGDCQNGRGEMLYADGSRYSGEWREGKRHGEGILTRANGSQFAGQWQDDERRGQAVYAFTNRAKYAIEWTGNKPQTNGPWAWSDGGKYVGGQDNREHGQGTVSYNDGATYIGG